MRGCWNAVFSQQRTIVLPQNWAAVSSGVIARIGRRTYRSLIVKVARSQSESSFELSAREGRRRPTQAAPDRYAVRELEVTRRGRLSIQRTATSGSTASRAPSTACSSTSTSIIICGSSACDPGCRRQLLRRHRLAVSQRITAVKSHDERERHGPSRTRRRHVAAGRCGHRRGRCRSATTVARR